MYYRNDPSKYSLNRRFLAKDLYTGIASLHLWVVNCGCLDFYHRVSRQWRRS